MKFMISWSLYSESQHDTLALFSNMAPEEEKALMGDNVRLIGRWHDVVSGEGVAIVESDNFEAVSAYALNWNRFMHMDITPVMDDEETRNVGRSVSP